MNTKRSSIYTICTLFAFYFSLLFYVSVPFFLTSWGKYLTVCCIIKTILKTFFKIVFIVLLISQPSHQIKLTTSQSVNTVCHMQTTVKIYSKQSLLCLSITWLYSSHITEATKCYFHMGLNVFPTTVQYCCICHSHRNAISKRFP